MTYQQINKSPRTNLHNIVRNTSVQFGVCVGATEVENPHSESEKKAFLKKKKKAKFLSFLLKAINYRQNML